MDITANTADIIFQNLRADFQKGIEEAKTVADPLYDTVPSTGDSTVYKWLGHTPGFKEWHKGQSRVLRNVESFTYTVANRKFEDTIVIDVDTVEDDQLSSYAGLGKALGVSAKQLYDELVFDLFNNAFGTTTTYDGLAWCANTHQAGISTVDNDLGTSALSKANAETAITTLKSFTVRPDKSSKARPLNPIADKLVLVCNPALEMTANEIFGRKLDNSGEENIMYGKADVLATSYITSSTAWFILNLSGVFPPIRLQERMKPTFRNLTPNDSDSSFMRDEYVYGGKCRAAAYPTMPWLIVGSRGA